MNTAVTSGDDEIRRIPAQARCGGQWTVFGLDEYRLAPINLEVVRSDDFQADLEIVRSIATKGLPTMAQIGAIARIVLASLVRNYPDMNEEAVLRMVDLGNAKDVLGSALGVSGYMNGKVGAPGGGERADWDGIYCSLIGAFGWTWEYIDEQMTLPRLEAIVKHWDEVPPLAVSASQIASALGVSKSRMFVKTGVAPAPGPKKAGMAELAAALTGASGFTTIGAPGV